MKGLINIPILIAFVLILGITPFALKLVQQNQNPENQAADISIKSIPCLQLVLAQKRYCQQTYPSPQPINNGIPCAQFSATITQYCH